MLALVLQRLQQPVGVPVGVLRAVVVALLLIGGAEPAVGQGLAEVVLVVGVEGEGVLEVLDGIIDPTLLGVHVAQIAVELRERRLVAEPRQMSMASR